MKKKEIIIVVIIALCAIGIYMFMKPDVKQESAKIIVTYNDKAIDVIDPNVDGIYEYKGNYGTFHLEVEDGRWHAVDVDCPTQECVHVGWVGVDDYLPIICLPNGFAVVLEDINQ